MKNLTHFIKEELDNNIFYLIDVWFDRNEIQKQEFESIVISYLNKPIIKNELLKQLEGTSLNGQLKEFVNFVENNIEINNDEDYINSFIQILKQVTYRTKIKGTH